LEQPPRARRARRRLPRARREAVPPVDLSVAAKELLGGHVALCAALGGGTLGAGLSACRARGCRPGARLERAWRGLDTAAALLRHPGAVASVVARAVQWAAMVPGPAPDPIQVPATVLLVRRRVEWFDIAGESEGGSMQDGELGNPHAGEISVEEEAEEHFQTHADEHRFEKKGMLGKVGWKKDFIGKNTSVLPNGGVSSGVNKMDCDTAAYQQASYDEIGNEKESMLGNVGWKEDFTGKNTSVLPNGGVSSGVNKMDCDTAAYQQASYDEIDNEKKSMLGKGSGSCWSLESEPPVRVGPPTVEAQGEKEQEQREEALCERKGLEEHQLEEAGRRSSILQGIAEWPAKALRQYAYMHGLDPRGGKAAVVPRVRDHVDMLLQDSASWAGRGGPVDHAW